MGTDQTAKSTGEEKNVKRHKHKVFINVKTVKTERTFKFRDIILHPLIWSNMKIGNKYSSTLNNETYETIMAFFAKAAATGRIFQWYGFNNL